MQRIDQYGVALHAGQLPGYRASHGCIRLPSEFAKRLYGVTDLGATVMIGS
jgi:lipoprotein-anchoring transpeptidase ErfK/SrfK